MGKIVDRVLSSPATTAAAAIAARSNPAIGLGIELLKTVTTGIKIRKAWRSTKKLELWLVSRTEKIILQLGQEDLSQVRRQELEIRLLELLDMLTDIERGDPWI